MTESTTLSYRDIGRWKYRLECDITVDTGIKSLGFGHGYAWLYPAGRLWIAEGYRWDGASGPTIDTPDTMRGSLVHDALYQFMRLKLLGPEFRVEADKAFRRLLRADGMGWFRAWYFYRAVRRFGAGAARAASRPTDAVITVAVGGGRQ